MFSDDDDEINNFIDDSGQPREDVSFYRKFEPNNLNHYYKFPNQTIDPRTATYKIDELYFGEEDQQPELYGPENRDSIEFDKFFGFEKSVKKFQNTLKNFKNPDNPFFDSIVYDVMCHTTKGKILDKDKMKDVLGNDFYNDLIEKKNDTQLDRTIFGYFDRCFLVNKVLAKYNFFFKFFGQRDIYRFQIKIKVEDKNTVTRNLSNSVLEKFNGYEIIRHELACQEKREFVPIDTVYEPVYNYVPVS